MSKLKKRFEKEFEKDKKYVDLVGYGRLIRFIEKELARARKEEREEFADELLKAWDGLRDRKNASKAYLLGISTTRETVEVLKYKNKCFKCGKGFTTKVELDTDKPTCDKCFKKLKKIKTAKEYKKYFKPIKKGKHE